MNIGLTNAEEELLAHQARNARRQRYLNKKWRDGWSKPKILDDGLNQKLK